MRVVITTYNYSPIRRTVCAQRTQGPLLWVVKLSKTRRESTGSAALAEHTSKRVESEGCENIVEKVKTRIATRSYKKIEERK
jgi:hypothetical protein